MGPNPLVAVLLIFCVLLLPVILEVSPHFLSSSRSSCTASSCASLLRCFPKGSSSKLAMATRRVSGVLFGSEPFCPKAPRQQQRRVLQLMQQQQQQQQQQPTVPWSSSSRFYCFAAASPSFHGPNAKGPRTLSEASLLPRSLQALQHPRSSSSSSSGGDEAAALRQICGSVVKVYSDYTDPNYALPWQMQRQGSSTGSGFVVKGRQIITNAHCVAWHNRLQVRKHGSPTKYPARVLSVGHECDLALLTVDDEEFWKDTQGLEFGDIDAAINPGNSGGPAIKEGRVVGVAFQGWDAAQNVGYVVPASVISHFFNDIRRHSRYTGFPAAGVVYQQLENESMREKLGVSELKKEELPSGVTPGGILVTATDSVRSKIFLERAKQLIDLASGGKAAEPTDAAAAAAADGEVETPKADPAPVVREAAAAVEAAAAAVEGEAPLTPAEKREMLHKELEKRIGLEPDDVILAVEGVDVASDGTVHFRDMERVSVSHVIADKFMGETLAVTVLRDRKVQDVVVPLEAEHSLIPKHQWGRKARYLVYGGLVFCPLSLEYLKDEFGSKFHERAPSTLLRPLSEVFASEEGEEPIVLTQILASDLTIGYSCRNCLLSSVDGVKVRNLQHLALLLGVQTPKQQQHQQYQQQLQQSEYVTFLLEEKLQVVLHRGKAEAMLPAILQQHAIPKQTSEQL